MLLLWSKQRPERGGGSKGRRKTTKQVADDLPRTSHPPASLRCTGRSHCRGSVLDPCSFFPFCIPSSDHRCTLVCKAHSDKIPARSRARRWAGGSALGAKGPWWSPFVYGLDDARTKWASCRPLLCVSYNIVWILRETLADWKPQPATETWEARTKGRRRLAREPLGLASSTVEGQEERGENLNEVLGGGQREFTLGTKDMAWLKGKLEKNFNVH